MKLCLFVSLIAVFQLGCNPQQPPAAPPATSATPSVTPSAPSGESSTDAPPGESRDEAAPADGNVSVEVKDFDGIQELIASKRGKVVVLDCWSTWCAPCVREFPALVKLHEQYGPDRVACISLSFNYDGGKNETPEEHKEEVLEFLRSKHAAFDNIIASVPAEELYGLLHFETPAIPAIFVYDREGKIARQFEGPAAKYSDVEKLVAELLEQP